MVDRWVRHVGFLRTRGTIASQWSEGRRHPAPIAGLVELRSVELHICMPMVSRFSTTGTNLYQTTAEVADADVGTVCCYMLLGVWG